jgi:hypothetical protein
MATDDERRAALKVSDLVKDVCPLLSGKPPEVVGAALADLAATYVISYAPELRTWVFDQWVQLMRNMMVINDKIMFPDGWHAHNDRD